MKSMKVRFAVLLLLAGVLSACASPAANNSAVTRAPATTVAATEAPATAAPASETAAPTAGETPTAGSISSGATVSFATDIQPLIESRCINCHGGNKTEKGLNMKSYAELMTGSENGPVVTPGDAEHSKMAELVINGKMPKRGPKLTPDQVQLIMDWINQGALDN